MMSRESDDLSALETLYRKGVLTASAYHEARAKLVPSSPLVPMLQRANVGTRQERWHIENRLLRAESDWQTVRETLIVRDSNGREHVPNVVRSAAVGVAVAVLVSVAGVMQNPSGLGGIIAGLGVAIGGAVSFDGLKKAQAYRSAEAAHLRAVAGLRREIAAFDSGD